MTMGALFVFTFKAGMVLLALLLIYKLLLAGDKQPGFNRWLLLSFYVIAPAAVAMAGMEWSDTATDGGIVEAGMLRPLQATDTATTMPASSMLSWASIVLCVWIAGMATVCVMTAVCLLRIRREIRRGDRIKCCRHDIVVTDNGGIAPFSVRNTIVMSRRDYDEAADIIIMHEYRHIQGRHWIDLCIARAAIIVCWYNPAVWLMADELRTVHEYQADEAVLKAGTDARRYQMLLIKKAVGRSFPAIANSLNHSKLKKRITMMLKTKESKGRRWRALALAPAIAAVLMAGNIPAVANSMATLGSASLPSVSADKVTKKADDVKEKSTSAQTGRTVTTTTSYNYRSNGDNNTQVQTSSTVTVNGETISITENPKIFVNGKEVSADELDKTDFAKTTEIRIDQTGDKPTMNFKIESDEISETKTDIKMPSFPGGDDEMYKWLATNIKYPDTEAAKKITEKVRVVVQFTIAEDGKITDVSLTRKSDLPEFNEEALRVVRAMPVWNPGKKDGKPVALPYALPITFKAQ